MADRVPDDFGRQYAVVARAIEFLRAHALRQPSLAELADAVHLSEFHLQRVFAAWAGISPKRFLQYLTKAYAIQTLRDAHNVLAVAAAAGSALAANTIGYLIPCHRVIRESGDPGNYRWGSSRKAAMLAWEAGRAALR